MESERESLNNRIGIIVFKGALLSSIISFVEPIGLKPLLSSLFAGAFRQGTPNGYPSTNSPSQQNNNGSSKDVRDTSSPLNHSDSDYKYGRFDVSALHIAHALKQTEVQKAYNKAREKPIDHYLVSN